jgi:ASC-1-like (ASCH) protein
MTIKERKEKTKEQKEMTEVKSKEVSMPATATRKEWKITVNSPWFEHIRDKKKIYEGRCLWKNNALYKIGDILYIHQFGCGYDDDEEKKDKKGDKSCEPFKVIIQDISRFANFTDALNEVMKVSGSIETILPGISSVKEGVEIYEKFYSPESQLTYGVALFKLRKVAF